MTEPKLCKDCGNPTDVVRGKYCSHCRWKYRVKPALYPLTAERHAYLLAHYRPQEKGISTRIARTLRVPTWKVTRWAQELGLATPATKAPAWTPEQDAFLEQHLGTRHPAWIARQLKRSVAAVIVRSKRLAISRRDARTWLTAQQVAIGFGVDPSTAVRWIEKGLLQATREGQDHASGRPFAWRVEFTALRSFIQQHPSAYSLAKVDQVWFLDVVFNGAIGAQERAA